MTGASRAYFLGCIFGDTGWSNRQGISRCSTGNSLSFVSAVNKKGAADARIVCGSFYNTSVLIPLLTRTHHEFNLSMKSHQGKSPIPVSEKSVLSWGVHSAAFMLRLWNEVLRVAIIVSQGWGCNS
jgi:hypothetical protein